MAVSLAGAEALGSALQTALAPARHVAVIRESFPAGEPSEAIPAFAGLLARAQPNLVVFCLPGGETPGIQAAFQCVCDHSDLSVLAVLEPAPAEEFHRLMALGAADFCLSPLRFEDLLPRVIRWATPTSPARLVAGQLVKSLGLQQFLGESRVFVEVVNQIPKMARCDANVLITGETGTGKEMCARATHHLGPRAEHPFVPVNCGAVPSELVENELFGHDAGAFTSAASAARGLVYEAEGGTLFLDEIDSLPLHVQVKFLRFLQDREYRPLGARKARHADVRIVAASNADLAECVRSGKFRSDLYYRLNVLPLKLPPLRERRQDIPLLARHFVAKFARGSAAPARELSRAALAKLAVYDWPGNIRELENVIERAIVISEKPLVSGEDICLPGDPPEDTSFKALKRRAIVEFESGYIRQLLATNDGNISQAARAAKKNRRAFWQLMRKHNIGAPRRPAPAMPPTRGQMPARPRTNLS